MNHIPDDDLIDRMKWASTPRTHGCSCGCRSEDINKHHPICRWRVMREAIAALESDKNKEIQSLRETNRSFHRRVQRAEGMALRRVKEQRDIAHAWRAYAEKLKSDLLRYKIEKTLLDSDFEQYRMRLESEQTVLSSLLVGVIVSYFIAGLMYYAGYI